MTKWGKKLMQSRREKMSRKQFSAVKSHFTDLIKPCHLSLIQFLIKIRDRANEPVIKAQEGHPDT
jgi:hypothetical protein